MFKKVIHEQLPAFLSWRQSYFKMGGRAGWMGYWCFWIGFLCFLFVSLASKVEVDYARDKTELEDAASQTVNNIFPQCKTETLALAEFKNH